jgi:uncharacterized Zn-binding protein involved in type VI secretion
MTVFANGLEISAEAQGCKVIAAFPDTCFTPPQTPATPPGVPLPYPDFGLDSDLTSGSTTVMIGDKPISQENSSHYSKCTGDEAGCAPKKGIITSKNTGKVYAQAWSMDVKVQGKGVARFGDMATSNHASNTGDTPPMGIVGTPAVGVISATADCLVGEYNKIVKECSKRGGEAHHITPDKCFRTGTRDQAGDATKRIANAPTLNSGMAICLTPEAHTKIHQGEKDSLKPLGKPGLAGLSGKALDTAADKLKASGEYGTAKVADIYDASNDMLDTLAPEVTSDCIKIAKEAIKTQGDKFNEGQIGRTSGSLPNPVASARMIPP